MLQCQERIYKDMETAKESWLRKEILFILQMNR